MRKIAIILLLSVAIIFAAGCVSPTTPDVNDPIIGNWETVEVDTYYLDYSYTGQMEFNADGTGTMVYSYDDGVVNTYPITWSQNEDGSYTIAETVTFTVSEDGSTLTEPSDETYVPYYQSELCTLWDEVVDEGALTSYAYYFFNGGYGLEEITNGDNFDYYDVAWEQSGNTIYAHVEYYAELLKDGTLDCDEELYKRV